MQTRKLLAFAGCLLSALGCGGQSASFDEPLTLLGSPVALDNELVFVDVNRHHAILMDVAAAPEPRPKAIVGLPFGPISAERRSGFHNEALVLCAGQRSTPTSDAEPAALALVTQDGKVRSYELGTTPFDTLAQSGDGRYAVLFRSKNDDGRLINNANEIVIVDLKQTDPHADGARTHKTPQSFGHTPTGAVFSPTMRIAGEERRLLLILSAAEVTIIDLNHLDRRETIVQLGDSNRAISPTQVLFSETEPTLYIRGTGSDDIFAFVLKEHANDAKGNDFRPSINQLGGGVGPSDMALFTQATAARLLVAVPSAAQAVVVDPSSSKATAIMLGASARQIFLFTATSPHDTKPAQRALLYTINDTQLTFLDLTDVETRRERNLESLTLPHPIASLIPLPSEGKVIVLHDGFGVSVLDLAERSIVPITSSAMLSTALFDAAKDRLWVAPTGQPRIGTLDLKTGSTDEIVLDQDIQSVVPMFKAKRLAVLHSSDIGYLTLVDSVAPSRDTAVSVRGFLIADVLDRGAP